MALKERVLKQVKFEKPGDFSAGYLMRIDEVTFADRTRGTRYMVREKNGEVSIFLGNHVVNDLLQRSDVGRWIRLEFTGVQQVKNGEMKMFKAWVDEEDVLPGSAVPNRAIVAGGGAVGMQINDDDIPF